MVDRGRLHYGPSAPQNGLVRFLAWLSLFALRAAAASAVPTEVAGHLRSDPVLPVQLADYELATLQVTKEIVFQIGDQTAIGHLPVLVYVPTRKPVRVEVLARLLEARHLLVKAAAAAGVSAGDLAALRDLLERAIGDLRENPPAPPPAPPRHG